mmetsp:Transcript_16592/g.36780  ORF Transcript_16592/g.36780 Transcript_16592/m.36780 type:complete len:201 (+) Transcript_16592:657-1259(+)
MADFIADTLRWYSIAPRIVSKCRSAAAGVYCDRCSCSAASSKSDTTRSAPPDPSTPTTAPARLQSRKAMASARRACRMAPLHFSAAASSATTCSVTTTGLLTMAGCWVSEGTSSGRDRFKIWDLQARTRSATFESGNLCRAGGVTAVFGLGVRKIAVGFTSTLPLKASASSAPTSAFTSAASDFAFASAGMAASAEGVGP